VASLEAVNETLSRIDRAMEGLNRAINRQELAIKSISKLGERYRAAVDAQHFHHQPTVTVAGASLGPNITDPFLTSALNDLRVCKHFRVSFLLVVSILPQCLGYK